MTQKSQARKARDAEAKKEKLTEAVRQDYYKKNNCWDELNSMYEKFGHGLGAVAEMMDQISQIPEIEAYFDPRDASNTITALRALRSDLSTFTTELAGIGQLHRHLTGGARDEDGFVQMTGIFDSYTNYEARFHQIISPNFHFLTEQVSIALNRMEEAKKAAALTDPAVVSDVAAREVPLQ